MKQLGRAVPLLVCRPPPSTSPLCSFSFSFSFSVYLRRARSLSSELVLGASASKTGHVASLFLLSSFRGHISQSAVRAGNDIIAVPRGIAVCGRLVGRRRGDAKKMEDSERNGDGNRHTRFGGESSTHHQSDRFSPPRYPRATRHRLLLPCPREPSVLFLPASIFRFAFFYPVRACRPSQAQRHRRRQRTRVPGTDRRKKRTHSSLSTRSLEDAGVKDDANTNRAPIRETSFLFFEFDRSRIAQDSR